MAKKLVAVTEVRHNDEVIAAGETLDASKFDKKQLEALYDAGAVRVEEGSETTTTQTQETESTRVTSADQSAEASSPAKTTSSTQAAAGSKETVNAKSGAK